MYSNHRYNDSFAKIALSKKMLKAKKKKIFRKEHFYWILKYENFVYHSSWDSKNVCTMNGDKKKKKKLWNNRTPVLGRRGASRATMKKAAAEVTWLKKYGKVWEETGKNTILRSFSEVGIQAWYSSQRNFTPPYKVQYLPPPCTALRPTKTAL